MAVKISDQQKLIQLFFFLQKIAKCVSINAAGATIYTNCSEIWSYVLKKYEAESCRTS